MSEPVAGVAPMTTAPLLPAPVPHDDAPAALVRVLMHRREAYQAAVAEMVAVLEHEAGGGFASP